MDDNNLSFFLLNNIKKGPDDISHKLLKKWSLKNSQKYCGNVHISDYYRGTFTIDRIITEEKVRLKLIKNNENKKKK